ncbi:MAG: DNA glycosylase AlkZ-like family protein [Anaerolineales bacterium]
MRFSVEQLRGYTLARQGLLQRLPSAALTRLGPLYAGDHTAPYLALLARIQNFAWEQFADAWYDDGAFVRLHSLRDTPHIIPVEYADIVGSAYNLDEGDRFAPFDEYDISFEEAVELRFFISELLAGRGPLSGADLKTLLDPDLIFEHVSATGHQMTSIHPVLAWMWRLGVLGYGAGVSDWRHKDAHYRLSPTPPPPTDPEVRRRADQQLAQWYFLLYGPASYQDWVHWSGLDDSRCQMAFAALEPDLVAIEVADMAAQLWMLSGEYPAFTETPADLPPMVRLLPAEDAFLHAYAQTRSRFYDTEGLAGEIIFNRHGQAEPTVWVDGRIIGVWSWHKKADEPMTVEPFEQMTRALRKRLKDEVERVQQFTQASHVLWIS